MFENEDVVELAPHDSTESKTQRGSSLSKMVGTLASSAAVAGGIFVGNLLITDQIAESGQNSSTSNDQAVADSLPTPDAPSGSPASGQTSSGALGLNPVSPQKPKTTTGSASVQQQAAKVDLGSVSYSNSTNATQGSGSYSGAGNSTNSTQVAGGSHGESGEGHDSGEDGGHEDGHDGGKDKGD